MKNLILLLIIGLSSVTNAQAQVSSSDQFFAAFQVSQVTGLPTLIHQYANTPNTIEAIAKTYFSMDGHSDLLKKYEQDQLFKQRVQKAISDYVNSKEASQLYDTLATDMLTNIYNYEELKALYQLYDTPNSQVILANQLKSDLAYAFQSQQKANLFQQTLQKETDKLLASYTSDNNSDSSQYDELKTLPPKVLIPPSEQNKVVVNNQESKQPTNLSTSPNDKE